MHRLPNLDEATDQTLGPLFVGQGYPTMSKGKVVSYGLGELSPTRRNRRHEDKHPIPKGCQWSPDCGTCPWEDCRLPQSATPLKYASPEARQLRAQAQLRMETGGLVLKDIAGIMHISMTQVKRLKQEAGINRYSRWLKRSYMAIELIIQTKPEEEVAKKYHVHVRTVRRAKQEFLMRPSSPGARPYSKDKGNSST